MLKPLARDTLTKQATDTLRHFILGEGLKAGDQLPSERELSETLSVSRNIVREALSVLVAEGLIVKKAGRGIFVTDYDPSQIRQREAVPADVNSHNLADLSEARAAIEFGAAELMAKRITPDQLRQLHAINRDLAEKLRRRRSTVKSDIEFHKILILATHNAVLVELIPLIVEQFRLTIAYRPALILNNQERIIAEHQEIINALTARDAAAVRRSIVAHLHLHLSELTAA